MWTAEETTRLLGSPLAGPPGSSGPAPDRPHVGYGTTDESELGELTDGGAWTDAEVLSIVRNQAAKAEWFPEHAGQATSLKLSFDAAPGPADPGAPKAVRTPWLALTAVSLLGFSTEFAWAVGEATLMPHMIKTLDVSVAVASLVWLTSPVVSVFLQPTLGRVMDAQTNHGFGRRRPFVVAIGLSAICGIFLLLVGEALALRLGLPTLAVVAVIIFAFGLADLSHDCLLIPGRALIGDMAEAHGSEALYQAGHAMFSGFQASGRLTAELAGMFPLLGLGLYDSHDTYRTLFTLAAGFILLCCTIACFGSRGYDPWTAFPFAGQDKSSSTPSSGPAALLSPRGGALQSMKRHFSAGDLPRSAQSRPPPPFARRKLQLMPILECRQRRRRWDLPLNLYQTDTSDASEEGDEVLSSETPLMAMYEENSLVLVILMLGVVGWVALNAMSFYWTLWIRLETRFPGTDLRLSFVSLAAQACTMTAIAACLPWLNSLCGELAVFLSGQCLLVCCMACTKLWTGPGAVLALACGLGVSMVIHCNNTLTICEHMVDNARLRATVMGVVNSTMPVGQIITAIVSGPVIQYLRGDVAAYYFWLALVHALVLGAGTMLLLIDHFADDD